MFTTYVIMPEGKDERKRVGEKGLGGAVLL